MKRLRIVFSGFLCLFITHVLAHSYDHCAHCSMDIRNDRFRAKAVTNDGNTLTLMQNLDPHVSKL
ncbi:hypothetical protein ACA086_14215 [Muriicola sp. E247]|uniref:hypothetical protein n=1 Tax=unclassified Muriicola TaxID=2647561 RepID=UPI00350FC733